MYICDVLITYKMKKQIRLGKTHYRHAPNKQGLQPSYIQRPWVNLSGRWLEDAGFPIGAPITIEVAKRKLIITTTYVELQSKAYEEDEESF
jgi:hypothetical protein